MKTDSTILLKAQNLAHSFEHTLYEDINLELTSGKSIAILGVSGSGKSTLINNLSTLLPPKKGKVSIKDKDDIYSLSSDELLKIRRSEIGIIFQFHYLFRGFSALENLKVASILSKQDIDMNLLESFGISSVLDQQIGSLSGGQQQRLSIARVLTKKPQIIFADEPTGNLDRETTFKVMEIVFKYIENHKASMFIATHNIELANMCDSVYELKNCRLIKI